VEDYKNEDWVSLYQSAFLELEQAKMAGRIGAAQLAIIARLEKLKSLPKLHPEERHAIEDALRALKLLAAEETRLDTEQARRAVERSLEQIRTLDSFVKGGSEREDGEPE
jgi:hypothetical protein